MKLIAQLSALSITISFLFSISLFSQDVNEKIKDIEGEANKITITTENGVYTFEGDDAAKLFKKMKSSSNSFVWHSAEKDGKKKIVFFDSDDEEHHVEVFGGDDEDLIIISEDVHEDMEGMHKKINVEIKDGNKKVTVTKKENGEEKIEVYEGDEADKFIKEMNEEHGDDMDIFIEKDSDDGKVKKKKIIIEKKTDKKSE
jgi:protease II